MNLPALWAYGAGITTGLIWRDLWKHRPNDWFWNAWALILVLACLWPVIFLLILFEAYRKHLNSIDGLDHDE